MYGNSYPIKMGCGLLQTYSVAKVTSVHHSSLTEKSLSFPNNSYFHFTLGNTIHVNATQHCALVCLCNAGMTFMWCVVDTLAYLLHPTLLRHALLPVLWPAKQLPAERGVGPILINIQELRPHHALQIKPRWESQRGLTGSCRREACEVGV